MIAHAATQKTHHVTQTVPISYIIQKMDLDMKCPFVVLFTAYLLELWGYRTRRSWWFSWAAKNNNIHSRLAALISRSEAASVGQCARAPASLIVWDYRASLLLLFGRPPVTSESFCCCCCWWFIHWLRRSDMQVFTIAKYICSVTWGLL
jgi:hypothetical protein